MSLKILQDIHCPHFPSCSGCVINKAANNPPILQEVQDFFEQQSIPFDYYSDQVNQWRLRAKLGVRGSSNHPLIGLYKAGTHQLIDIPHCLVHHPQINKAVEFLKQWIKENQIDLYDEVGQQGLLRYIQCVVERSTGRVQLSLVLNAVDNSASKYTTLLQSLWNKEPLLWHSLWINLNRSRTNNIFGEQWILGMGNEYIQEKLAGVEVCYHPANFAQANLDVFEKMLFDLKADLEPNAHIVEFYAGVGVIGLCMADKAISVTCSEINSFAEIAFNKSLALLPKQNVTFVTGSSANQTALLKHSDVVIVDPPRKGLDKPLLKALTDAPNIKELWYISCGWPAFKKDCAELQKTLKLNKAKAYLFFPGTNQLELLIKFIK